MMIILLDYLGICIPYDEPVSLGVINGIEGNAQRIELSPPRLEMYLVHGPRSVGMK
jgi:hypothetical protein